MKPAQVNAALLDMLSQGADIQAVIDQGSLMIGQPLLIVDTRFRILYMSSTVDPQIPLWQEAKASRYISDDILASLQEVSIPSKLFDSSVPLQADLPNGYHAARYALRYRDSYRGFLGMYDYQRPFVANDMVLMQSVGKAINALLPGDSDLNSVDENAYESLLYQLLRCRTEEQAALIYRKHPRTALGNQMLLFALLPGENAGCTLPQLKELLHQALHRHVSIIMNDRIFLLLETDQMSAAMYQKTLENIDSISKKDNIQVGVSCPFSSPSFLPSAYQQTEICLQRRKEHREPGMYRFEDSLLYSVAQTCLSQHSANFYLHPIIQRLKEYDDTYHVHYLDTLKAFIANTGSLKATAATMGVHYNTIKYRMAAIENIAGVPLYEQGELLVALHLSLLIDDLHEQLV